MRPVAFVFFKNASAPGRFLSRVRKIRSSCPAPNVACTKSIAFWIRFSSACSAASICAVPSSHRSLQRREIFRTVQQRMHLSANSRSRSSSSGASTPSSFRSAIAFSRRERFSFAAESGLFADCTLDRKLTRLPVSAFFCRKVFSSRETACSKNSVAARRASKAHTPEAPARRLSPAPTECSQGRADPGRPQRAGKTPQTTRRSPHAAKIPRTACLVSRSPGARSL